CFHHMLPTLPVAQAREDGIAGLLAGVEPASCPLQMNVQARGSLDAVSLTLRGDGQGMTLEANAELAPLDGMPLREADIALTLPDGSSLTGQAAWEAASAADSGPVEGDAAPDSAASMLVGELSADRLDAGQLAGGAI